MRYFIVIILVPFILGCNNQSERKEDFGAFHITLPKGWKKFKEKGIDSYVGGITNGEDSLSFDYGWHSYDLSHEDGKKQLFATDTINGKIALITKPKRAGNGTIGIYIDKAFKENRFNLIGDDIDNEDLILNIFKSIGFADSNSSINSKNIEFSSEIIPYSGRSLFLINCAACHHRNRHMTGPAFASIEETKFRQWILDSLESVIPDSTKFGIQYHRKAFGKTLSESDIKKLIEYAKLK
ncbi:MAG: cytochrome c [Bacteroidota bacterium]